MIGVRANGPHGPAAKVDTVLFFKRKKEVDTVHPDIWLIIWLFKNKKVNTVNVREKFVSGVARCNVPFITWATAYGLRAP